MGDLGNNSQIGGTGVGGSEVRDVDSSVVGMMILIMEFRFILLIIHHFKRRSRTLPIWIAIEHKTP
jgi:hypothetical protein